MLSSTDTSFTPDMPITSWPKGSGLPLHAYGSVKTCNLVSTPTVGDCSAADSPPSVHLQVRLGDTNEPRPWYDSADGHLMTVQDVLNVALAHRDVLGKGAVVLEGTDPLSQATFASALIQVCQEAGLTTEMITSGSGSDRVADRMLLEIDLITISLPVSSNWSGGSAQEALKLAGRLQQLGCQIRLQLPVLNGLPLRPQDTATLIHALSKLTNLQSVDVYDCEDLASVPPAGPCRRHIPPMHQASAAVLGLRQELLAAGLRMESEPT